LPPFGVNLHEQRMAIHSTVLPERASIRAEISPAELVPAASTCQYVRQFHSGKVR